MEDAQRCARIVRDLGFPEVRVQRRSGNGFGDVHLQASWPTRGIRDEFCEAFRNAVLVEGGMVVRSTIPESLDAVFQSDVRGAYSPAQLVTATLLFLALVSSLGYLYVDSLPRDEL